MFVNYFKNLSKAQIVSKNIRIPGVIMMMMMMMMTESYKGEFSYWCFDFELNSTHNELICHQSHDKGYFLIVSNGW